jgi:hypothetical protein
VNIHDGQVTSRWLLYHGTSSYRLTQILDDNCLKLGQLGVPKLSLTPEHSVAEYFACNAVSGDRWDNPGLESEPVVLVLDGEGLVVLMYDLEDDTSEGEKYVWENEISCWNAIAPLDELLITVETVPMPRAQPYFELPLLEQRRAAYRPSGSRLSGHELSVVTHMVEQLKEGQITEDNADEIAAALARHRLSVRSSGIGLGSATAFDASESLNGVKRRPRSATERVPSDTQDPHRAFQNVEFKKTGKAQFVVVRSPAALNGSQGQSRLSGS